LIARSAEEREEYDIGREFKSVLAIFGGQAS